MYNTQTGYSNFSPSPILIIFYLALIIFYLVVVWKIFTKAGQPGWAALIPFYNIYVLLKIIGRPGWWLLLYFIPFVNIVINVMVAIDLAKSFGRSTVFGVVALWLFSFVGYPILGFGKDQYIGPAASKPPVTTSSTTLQATN